MFHKESFLEDLGIARQNHKPYTKRKLYIDKGEVDPKSFGGVSIISRANLSEQGALEDLNMRYWALFPDGRYQLQHLFQLETKPIGKNKLEITRLTVLGRDIALDDSKAIDNVIEAIRRIHVNLRDREAYVPNIASIFQDCCLEDIVGEKLPLPGFHLKARLYFPISSSFNIAAQNEGRPEISMPLEALRPLMGLRANTIDADHSYTTDNELRVRGVLPQVGRRFEIQSKVKKIEGKSERGKSRHLTVKQRELDVPDHDQKAKPIIEAGWRRVRGDSEVADLAVLTNLRLFGQNVLNQDFRRTIGAFGVINKMHADMLKLRDYPRILDHLAEYGHLESVMSSSAPPTAKGRFVLTSMGGNNLREIYPGIGEDIGGNCKVVETQWHDKKSKSIRKCGAIFDVGAYIIRAQSEWTGGGPDIIEKLEYCRDIFISHHHLDHLDFIIPYIKRGIITPQHRLHFTPEVYEMAKEKLYKWGIKKHDPRMPELNLLNDAGVIDIKDDTGVIRLSIAYGVDAVPHSAKDTPFIAYGRMGKRILGSYMYLGDMRYDEEWFMDHDSPFWNPVGLMLKHDPSLMDQRENLIPTYTEQDGTSSKRMERGAREKDVEENLVKLIENCLHDRHIGIPIIGTNDGRRETGLRVANRTGRKVSAFGSAVEKIFAIANKWGVNPYRVKRPNEGEYTGIKDYLKWHAEQVDVTPTVFAGRTSGKVKDWFLHDRPGTIMAFLSGSQGNPVEAESVTYKLSDGISYFDGDLKTSKTARPSDLRDWAIIVSQGAIPGNQKYQQKMIRKLASRGAIVFESFDDNMRIYNAGKLGKRIEQYMQSIGKSLIHEADTLVVENFSIHASGHGRNGDFRLWLQKLKAKFFGVHHTDDMESVQCAYETIEKDGFQHPGRIFQNGEEVEIGNDFVRAVGRTHSSVVLTREIAEEGKHYNKRLEAMRVINFDDRSPYNDLGLRGTANGVFEASFGVEDIDQVRNRAKTAPRHTRSKDCVSKPRRAFRRPIYVAPEWTPPTLPMVA